MHTYPSVFLRSKRRVRADIDRLLEALRSNAINGLQLGCGDSPIEGLINCDMYSDKADRKVDACDLGAFADGSVDYIENHHMIEHLSFSEARQAFKEWHRVLSPGGTLIITCPDMDAIFRKWIARKSWRAKLLPMIYGSQEHDGMYHRSGYNQEIITGYLNKAGFRVEFAYAPYPARSTPSMVVIARK